jgi:HTH-type transcriptional regulator / antitoxin HipB
MENDYPVRLISQMRQHLRSLRNKRGLTQAQAGALIGVSQSRIAEIEAEPGLVNFEQMLQLLSAMGVTLHLRENNLVETQAEPMPQPTSTVTGKTKVTQKKRGVW